MLNISRYKNGDFLKYYLDSILKIVFFKVYNK